MRKVLIFGCSGQDGSYLAELHLAKGDKVIGVARRTSGSNTERIRHILDDPGFSLLTGDITDFSCVMHILQRVGPDWVYNLAAQSNVGVSFYHACTSLDVTAQGFVNILEAVRLTNPNIRLYQASSSEMFGDSFSTKIIQHIVEENGEFGTCERYQGIDTKFSPQSPYAAAKLAAHNFANIYRKGYGIDARCGILFNHESPRRGEGFVTRKITKWIGNFVRWKEQLESEEYNKGCYFESHVDNIRLVRTNPDKKPYGSIEAWAFGNSTPKLKLGNLDASRDWGHAEDYVKAMYLIMEHHEPRDWVVSTGETYTIKDFLKEAFEVAELGDWRDYVVCDESLYRPCEVPFLKGDSDPIRRELGWKPVHNFTTLVKEMVNNDVEEARRRS